MGKIMNIIAIILVFGVIVFVHEFGHFIFAKMNVYNIFRNMLRDWGLENILNNSTNL